MSLKRDVGLLLLVQELRKHVNSNHEYCSQLIKTRLYIIFVPGVEIRNAHDIVPSVSIGEDKYFADMYNVVRLKDKITKTT